MITRTASFDPRIESYQQFFDENWASELGSLVEGTILDSPTLDLVRNWHAISNARALPWLMVQCLDRSLAQELEEVMPLDIRKLKFIRENLLSQLEQSGTKVRPMFRKKLHDALVALDKRADEVMVKAKRTVIENQSSVWEAFLEENTYFPTSLWALERICYCSLYYNYEYFLTECVRIKRNEPEYRMPRHEDFKDDFKAAFGVDCQQACWSDQKVVIARLARHSLVHNGGRLTPQLEKQPHGFLVNDGEIQVAAPHTTALFNLLIGKVLMLSRVVLSCVEHC